MGEQPLNQIRKGLGNKLRKLNLPTAILVILFLHERPLEMFFFFSASREFPFPTSSVKTSCLVWKVENICSHNYAHLNTKHAQGHVLRGMRRGKGLTMGMVVGG